MNLFNNKTILALFTAVLIGFTACSDPMSDNQAEEVVTLLVANEGNWSDGNGSITSFDPDSRQVIQEKFRITNGRPLAGIIQAVVSDGDRLFIVANNTDKIEVTDAASLESIATISFGGESGITPAGLAVAGDSKGYVSSLYDNAVYVLDLENYALTGTRIEAGNNPRKMVVAGDRLYVANHGFGSDNTITVINTENDQVLSTLEVGHGPVDMIPDGQDRLWVVCNGYKAFDHEWNRDPENDIPGRIDVLGAGSAAPLATIETGGFPKAMALDEDAGLGWIVNEQAVQQINIHSFELTDDAFIRRSFNGIGYSGTDERLYLALSNGYTQAGKAILYDIGGTAVDSFATGIAPFEFLFLTDTDR